MKTWTMPRVAVEAFRANEYVAGSCSDTFISDETQIRAVLFNGGNKILCDFDDTPDGYDNSGLVSGVAHLSSSVLPAERWSVGLTGPHMAWLRVAEGREQAARDLGFQVQLNPESTYEYWARIPVYYNGNGISYNSLWHPSSKTQDVNFS